MRWRLAAHLLWLGAAGCFSPSAREGLPCTSDHECPPDQSCRPTGGADPGVCVSPSDPDASPGAIDAFAGDGAPPPAPFGEPELVAITCTPACTELRDPWLSDDFSRIVFAGGTAAAAHDIYTGVARTPGVFPEATAFAPPINTVADELAPTMSSDSKQIWYTREPGAPVEPYGEIATSISPFDTENAVAGVVDTDLGDEVGASVGADGMTMAFARALDGGADHDFYLARLDGDQWNTVVRIEALLGEEGADERSISMRESARVFFFIRDGFVFEAHWSGDDPLDVYSVGYHGELDKQDPLDDKRGIWVSPDGDEIWFGSERSGTFQIYRATR